MLHIFLEASRFIDINDIYLLYSDKKVSESVLSGDDDDGDSIWGFNAVISNKVTRCFPQSTKSNLVHSNIIMCILQDTDNNKFKDDYFLGHGSFGLNPIRTSAQPSSQKRSTIFDESVPSTPMTNAGFSPTQKNDGVSGWGFLDGSSRYDSFNLHDDGLFPQRETPSRFDSMRSTKDSDVGHGFPSFDDSDPFGTGPFKTSFGETPRRGSDIWNESPRSTINFGETPRSTYNFGETPKSTYNFGETPKSTYNFGETPKSTYNFGENFSSTFNWGETPRSSSDPWGETPRRASDQWGETPRRSSNSWDETPRRSSDAWGETPRRGSDNWSAF